MKKVFSFLLFVVIYSHGLSAQDYTKLTVDTVVKRMVDQLLLYPQEKIHVQVDRSAYLPGDTVWLKAYLVHAAFHIPSNQSRYVYIELINPLDSLTNRIKLRPDKENMFYGYIPLPMELPDEIRSGIYFLHDG
ncbi:hypothetical protein EZS27_025301 [termite gut metagenome]|uniref:Macroglobulin domain-containing protein n=1 Tax=termite gut metagenome TaxID=433724 RepID=A0A5J4QXR1_9ZZZZ